MVYWILSKLFPEIILESPMLLFGYTTVRAALALFFAFFASLILGPSCIRHLAALKMGQQVRNFKTSETQQFNIHQEKAGTTTMGGLLIIGSTLIASILFCDLSSSYVWLVLFVMVGLGALGFSDDYLKVVKRNHKGISARTKLLVQVSIGLAVGLFLVFSAPHTAYATRGITGDTHLMVPFFKYLYPDLGIFFALWVALVICATSNAVNLTDGLDGLAIGTTIIVLLPLILIAYLVSRVDYSGFLLVPHVPQARDLAVLMSALLGAGLGFLWFNAHPAEVFMGDTGALAVGGVIGVVAVLIKHELLLVLIGGIFVVEALSVVVQVLGFKWTGRRLLRMSPLHNHYVRMGTDEAKIIARFLIVGILLALVGLSTLKLR